MGKKTNSNSKIFKKEIVDLKSIILEKNDRVIYTHIIFYMRNAYSYIASWANLPVKKEYIETWQEKNPKNKFPVKTDSDICFQARCIIDEIYSKYMVGFSFPTQKQLIVQTAIFFLKRIAILQEFPDYAITEQINWFINNTAGPILANRKFSVDRDDITKSITATLVKNASSGFCWHFIQNLSKEINTVCNTVGNNCAKGINPLRNIDLKHFQKYIYCLYSELGILESDCKLDFDVFKQCMRPFIRDIRSSKWAPSNNALFCAFFEIMEQAILATNEKDVVIPYIFSVVCTKKAFQSIKPIDSTLFSNIDIEKYINARTSIHNHVEENSSIDTAHEFYVISKLKLRTCPHCDAVSALEYHNYNLPVYYDETFSKYITVKLLSCRLCKRVFMTTTELAGILARLNPMISDNRRLILHPQNIRIKSRNASNGFIYEPIIDNNIVVHKNGTRTFYYTSAEDDANIGTKSTKYATNDFSTSNDTSFLSNMGYHSYISTEKRHAILLKALETHPPREITDLLNFFISTHGGNYWREQRYAAAIATWEADLQFVHENRNVWYDKHPRRRY